MGDLLGGSPDVPENRYANELADISRQRFELAQPLEQAIRDDLLRFMGYEFTPETVQNVYSPGVTAATSSPENLTSALIEPIPRAVSGTPFGITTGLFGQMGDSKELQSLYDQELMKLKGWTPEQLTDLRSRDAANQLDLMIPEERRNEIKNALQIKDTLQSVGFSPGGLQASTTTIPGGWKRTGKSFDVTSLPWYESGKRAISDAFTGAKDSILSMLPSGGGLADALAKARIGTATALSDFGSNLASDVFNKAYSYATGVPVQASQGLGSAANTYAQGFGPAIAAQGQQNDLLGMLGEGAAWAIDKIPWASVGSGISSAIGGLGSLFSTRRVKRDIVFVGELLLKNNKTIPMIEYNYVWDVGNNKRVGVLAEDAFEVLPEIVILENGKPIAVNYSALSEHVKGVM